MILRRMHGAKDLNHATQCLTVLLAMYFNVCRIDSSFVIKVADFGLSESIDITKDYFRQSQDNTIKLPIKWLAIESINDGIFSEKTDVVKLEL